MRITTFNSAYLTMKLVTVKLEVTVMTSLKVDKDFFGRIVGTVMTILTVFTVAMLMTVLKK